MWNHTETTQATHILKVCLGRWLLLDLRIKFWLSRWVFTETYEILVPTGCVLADVSARRSFTLHVEDVAYVRDHCVNVLRIGFTFSRDVFVAQMPLLGVSDLVFLRCHEGGFSAPLHIVALALLYHFLGHLVQGCCILSYGRSRTNEIWIDTLILLDLLKNLFAEGNEWNRLSRLMPPDDGAEMWVNIDLVLAEWPLKLTQSHLAILVLLDVLAESLLFWTAELPLISPVGALSISCILVIMIRVIETFRQTRVHFTVIGPSELQGPLNILKLQICRVGIAPQNFSKFRRWSNSNFLNCLN